jgi:hypothetical protein
MDDGACRQHLGIEPRTARHQPVEDAAVPVGPIHHRRNAVTPAIEFAHVSTKSIV